MRLGRIDGFQGPRWVQFDGALVHVLARAPWLDVEPTGETLALESVRTLAPVAPGKIVCVGRNYRAHAKELGNEVPSEPLLFLKPPSAVIGHDDLVELPPQSARVEHEGELAVVMGTRISQASVNEALDAIFGYTCANDVTARDLQRKDVQFTRGKGFDTFCPLGPWIEMDAAVGPSTTLCTRVNGVVRQQGEVGAMVFPIGELLAYISNVMTLEAGDVVLTGTPEGVGPLAPGDRVEIEISGVGTLVHGVCTRPVRTPQQRE